MRTLGKIRNREQILPQKAGRKRENHATCWCIVFQLQYHNFSCFALLRIVQEGVLFHLFRTVYFPSGFPSTDYQWVTCVMQRAVHLPASLLFAIQITGALAEVCSLSSSSRFPAHKPSLGSYSLAMVQGSMKCMEPSTHWAVTPS